MGNYESVRDKIIGIVRQNIQDHDPFQKNYAQKMNDTDLLGKSMLDLGVDSLTYADICFDIADAYEENEIEDVLMNAERNPTVGKLVDITEDALKEEVEK